MKLDERLKQLNELPENEALKKKIAKTIQHPPKKSLNSWKAFREMGVFTAVCVIALFLIFTSNEFRHTAASNSIAKITSYENEGENGFRGRTSTLFIGVENSTTPEMSAFFERIDQLPTIAISEKSVPHYDIVVLYKNGEKGRYELSSDYVYDVDNHLYYGYTQDTSAIFSALESAHDRMSFPVIFIAVGVMAMNAIASSYYHRRKLEIPKKIRGLGLAITIYLIVLAVLGGYYYWIGPLYKPLLMLFVLGYGLSIWLPVKRAVTNLNILKMEAYKNIVVVLLFLVWIGTA